MSEPDFAQSIDNFKASFMDLKVSSVTPKIHAVFFHVKECFSKHRKGLGFYSEQAIEAVHSEFKILWSKDKVHISVVLYAIKPYS